MRNFSGKVEDDKNGFEEFYKTGKGNKNLYFKFASH